MRRATRHRLGRWAASGLAVAGLLTAGLAGTAGTAWADGQSTPIPVTFTGPDHYDVSLDGQGPPAGEYSFDVGVKAPGKDWSGEGTVPPLHQGSYTVTIDASALKGFADVRLQQPSGCDVTGLVVVCRRSELYSGTEFNLRLGVALTAADGAKAGDHGAVKITGQGDGLSFTNRSVDVLVGAPAYRSLRLHEPKGFQAGQTYAAPLTFRNTGGLDGHEAVLTVLGSRGLTFPQQFSNCRYGVQHPDNLLHMQHVAVCTFDGTFEVGQAYRLSHAWKVKTASFALRDTFVYHVSTEPPSLDGVTLHRGKGAQLTLKTASSDGTYVGSSELDFPSHNTYDLDLTGDRVDGAKGETVSATVTLTNHGPAWIGALRSGGEPIGFTVDVPDGATVTGVPHGCRPKGVHHPGRVTHYLCFADTPLLEKDSRTFVFKLRIDEVIKGAKARAYLPDYTDPTEADPSNDDGWIVLNGTGDEQTPGDDPSGTGSGNGDGSGTGTGGTDTSGGTHTGSTGGDGTDGTHTTGDESGALASTGSNALTLGGLAVLLLAGGAAVTVAVRRRRGITRNDAAA